MREGLKILVDRPAEFKRLNENKTVHSSVLCILHTTFTVRGYSKYLFDLKTMTSIGIEKLKVTII